MNKLIIPIIAVLIIAAGIGGYFVSRKSASPEINSEAKRNIPYYFIAIHNEPHNSEPGSREKIDQGYATLKEMVRKANEYNIKLTLMFTPQWADYISENSERMAELESWKKHGHEIAAHHHSIYHGNWDGYTDYTKKEAETQRIKQGKTPEEYLGTFNDYIDKLKKLNQNIHSGCVNEEHDKAEMPDEIIYGTCSGFANYGEPGRRESDAQNLDKGKNEFITVGNYKGIQRKWLTHYQTNNEVETAKKVVASMKGGVWGSVFHSNKRESVSFYAFLEFLHSIDSAGAKSKTVSQIIDQKLIPEKIISDDLLNEKSTIIGQPSSSGKCGDGICDEKEKANPDLCPKDCGQTTPPAVPALAPNSTPSPVVSSGNKFTDFITGFKLDNIDNVKEISKTHFELAKELKLDYIIVPVVNPRGSDINNMDWSKGLDYYYIFELSEQYGVKVLPAFYKLGGQGGQDDKNYTKYADFVVSFLDKFYKDGNINYIEFQNEPIKDYNGKASARFGGTPTDLAKSHLAAYDKVKIKYPLIKVGTAGFMAVAVSPDENEITNNYYKEYFLAKPKFDMLSLHHYPKTGSYLQTKSGSYSKYNFMSEYEILGTYRQFLNDYGYGDKPIFVSEGAVDMPFTGGIPASQWLSNEGASVLLLERMVLFLENGNKNNVISAITSNSKAQITGLFSYDNNSGASAKTELFEFYKTLLSFLEKYPAYLGHVSGEIDSENYWVLEFENNDNQKTWIAFCPFLFWAEADSNGRSIAIKKSITCPQEVTIDVGNVKSVKISTVSENSTVNAIDGKVSFKLEKNPVFVEEK